MKKLLLSSALFLTLTIGFSQTVYVDAGASGANDGSSWANAYNDLNNAITNTASGEIWIKAGAYYPGLSGNNAATFTLKNNVAIYGGFSGSETLLSQRDIVNFVTTLSGDLNQNFSKDAADAYHVVTTGNTNSSAILDGVTISGGNAVGGGANSNGGGVYSQPNVGGALGAVFRYCHITGNGASGSGAGAYISCVQTGGNSNGTSFYACKFNDNYATGAGGSIYVTANGSLTFTTPYIESCVFYNSNASGGGSDIGAQNNTSGEVHVQVTNCTFGTNGGNSEIEYIKNGINGTFDIDNSIFYGCDLFTDDLFLAENNCGPLTYLSGTGNANFDPQYRNAPSFDFRLSCTSSCIDIGNTAPLIIGTDILGAPRNTGANPDLGAYEGDFTVPVTVVANATGTVVCQGNMVTLYGSGSAGASYSWSGGISDNVGFTPSVTETFTITATDANGCVATDQISIIVVNPPTVSANASANIICEGDMLTLYGGGATVYSWDNGVSDNVPFAANYTGLYTVTGTDVNGCTNTSTIYITTEFTTGLTAGADQNVCATGSPVINLNGQSNTAPSVLWTTINGNGSFSNNFSDATDYFVTALDLTLDTLKLLFQVNFNACPTYSDTVNVVVRSLPSVTLPADYTICETDSILLQGNITGGTPPFIYNWADGTPVTISTANNEMYLPYVSDIYTLNVTDTYGCFGQDAMIVTVDGSEVISGFVNNSGVPLSNGKVYLYRNELQSMVLDTLISYTITPADNGFYTFPPIPYGNYRIKVIPDTLVFSNLVPTYYGNDFQWDSSLVITHNCNTPFNANIDVITLLGGTGTGTVSGYVIEDFGFGNRYGQNNYNIMIPGGPLKGIDVKLGRNPGGGIQARTTSGNDGKYQFNNLPADNYRIYVDIPGLPMDSSYTVTIDATNATYTDLNYYADSNSVYPILPTAVGIKNYYASLTELDVHPNPAKNYTSINFEMSSDNSAYIVLTDITGKELMKIKFNKLPKGKHEYQINFDNQDFKTGIYFLQVKTDTGIQTKKLIIE